VFCFNAHAASFLANCRAGRKGVHILVFCPWADGSFEFTTVPLVTPLIGIPPPNTLGGERLRSDSWEGCKTRLVEHFGLPAVDGPDLVRRFDSFVGDVRQASPRPAPKAAPTPSRAFAKRGLPSPKPGSGLEQVNAFLRKRGRR